MMLNLQEYSTLKKLLLVSKEHHANCLCTSNFNVGFSLFITLMAKLMRTVHVNGLTRTSLIEYAFFIFKGGNFVFNQHGW